MAGQIEESLGLSSYNLSYPGSDVEFHEFVLRSLLQFNRKPRVVLLVVDDPDELLPSTSLTFRYDRLYPLVSNYINNEMISRGQKSILSRWLCVCRVNRSNFHFAKKPVSAIDEILDCGSMPIALGEVAPLLAMIPVSGSTICKKK